MSLVELIVSLGLLAIFMLGIVVVIRGIEASWRSSMVRVPLAVTSSLIGQVMSEQMGQAHCLDLPAPGDEGGSLVGRVGAGCLDAGFADEGVRSFKFCADPGTASFRFWRGTGPPPAACSGPEFYAINSTLVEVSIPAGAAGAFLRPAGFPSRVDTRLHLKVPLPDGDARFWATGENERDWEDSFVAGAMPLRAP